MAGIKASANMWALLANDDPGDSAAAAGGRLADDGKAEANKGPARGKKQAVATGEQPESSGVVGGGAAKKDGKRARKERNKKQKKPAAATANGEASNVPATAGREGQKQHKGPAPATSTEEEAEDDSGLSDSDDEGGAAAAGGGCCRKFLRGLVHLLLTTAITTIVMNLALPSGTVGRPT